VTRSGGGWSATCTTAPSSAWSVCRWPCGCSGRGTGQGRRSWPRQETELRAAIDDLRALARGLFPVVLRDEGLGAALGALGETAPLRVTAVPPRRFADAVETTAYLVVARAAAHGPATVCATQTDGALEVAVTVDARIDGLGDLEDRVRALDGELAISSDQQSSTIRLSLPC
jgi:signal transduction histidine kinase